ncbi:hypothetical protein K466DRAFT_608012 [Polyporus arcularius HHB13444]|uniref:Uncharacterized protein n=1 Tax=Polyporus arcularius HHB13444 TaxID=1314778 RepID=A0A5C3NMR3_9APHY|nr:hypothetical protein K466DRAFT_608012 [Polyporus arcularius HHB13444]
MVLFADVAAALAGCPELYSTIHFGQLCAFFAVIHRLSPIITSSSPRRAVDLPSLPPDIAFSVAAAAQLTFDDTLKLWPVLGRLTMRTAPEELVLSESSVDARLAELASYKAELRS